MVNCDPQISVITPVYNAAPYIQESIESVLWQTFDDFELLLMDDGSTDESATIIGSYVDPRIRYVSCAHNFIETLNKGLDLATGKYIALLDHDDLMMPYRLQIQYDFMESNPHIAACGGFNHSFGWYSRIMDVALKHEDLVLYYSPVWNPTGFIRREVLVRHEIKYKHGYSFSADFKLWTDIMKVGEIANIPKVLTLYRTHKEQTSIRKYTECIVAARKIKNEMIDFYLSLLRETLEGFDKIVSPGFLLLINRLRTQHIVSEDGYYQLMREIIVYMYKARPNLQFSYQ